MRRTTLRWSRRKGGLALIALALVAVLGAALAVRLQRGQADRTEPLALLAVACAAVGHSAGIAGAARGHDLCRRSLFHRPDDGQVVTGLGTVAGLAGGEDHRHAKGIDLPGPLDGIGTGRGAAAVDVHLVARRQCRVLVHVDRHGHLFRPELLDHFRDDLRPAEGGAAGRDLIGPGLEHSGGRGHVGDAAADGKRHGCGIGHAADHIKHRGAILDRGRDVQQRQLISSRLAVGPGALDRIACVADVDEVNAFDHPAVLHI